MWVTGLGTPGPATPGMRPASEHRRALRRAVTTLIRRNVSFVEAALFNVYGTKASTAARTTDGAEAKLEWAFRAMVIRGMLEDGVYLS